MTVDLLEIEVLVDSEGTGFECVQIAPLSGERCAILFVVSDPDYVETYSIIFELENFAPETAKDILLDDKWLMSLTGRKVTELAALEATTHVMDWHQNNWNEAKISKTDLQRLWQAQDGRCFAIGSDGHSLVRDAGTWSAIKPGSVHQLHDIGGNASGDIYCCGSEGTVQRLNDNSWEVIDLHRTDLFRGIHVAADGTIRLAAGGGTCLEVRNLDEIIALNAPETTFFSVAEFKGSVYWGDEAGVYIQSGLDILPLYDTGFAFDLRCNDDYMYCVGTDRAWRFDGEAWLSLRLIFEDDVGFELVLE